MTKAQNEVIYHQPAEKILVINSLSQILESMPPVIQIVLRLLKQFAGKTSSDISSGEQK